MKRGEREREREREEERPRKNLFIRERRPERDPRPSEKHSERGESTPVLQADIFKHPVVGKGRWEGDGH
jgi:hypothetical protein